MRSYTNFIPSVISSSSSALSPTLIMVVVASSTTLATRHLYYKCICDLEIDTQDAVEAISVVAVRNAGVHVEAITFD
ncbi:hypothetical protein SLA2020_039590 [Shorea laevis]